MVQEFIPSPLEMFGVRQITARELATVMCDSFYARHSVRIRMYEGDDLRLWLEVYDLIAETGLDPRRVVCNADISSPHLGHHLDLISCLWQAERIYYTELARAKKWADYA